MRIFLQCMLTLSLLYTVKLQEPQLSSLDLLKAAPSAYKIVEKITDLQQSSNKEKKKS